MSIEEGTYRAKAVEGALGLTGTGKEQVGVRFELLDVQEGQRTITWYGYFTDKTFERTIQSLRYCGWEGSDLSDLTGIDTNEVDLVIEDEAGQDGEFRPRVKWVNSRGGLAMKERLDPGAAQAFAARMRGAILAFDKKGGGNSAARPPARQQPPPPTDDDFGEIPF